MVGLAANPAIKELLATRGSAEKANGFQGKVVPSNDDSFALALNGLGVVLLPIVHGTLERFKLLFVGGRGRLGGSHCILDLFMDLSFRGVPSPLSPAVSRKSSTDSLLEGC